MRGAAAALMREGSQGAFFRGLGTSMAGVRSGSVKLWCGGLHCQGSGMAPGLVMVASHCMGKRLPDASLLTLAGVLWYWA